jgi:putative Holliday junction resolvase
MRYLGLDVGLRRTGVAFADSNDDILFSLETISHTSEDELFERVVALVKEKSIDEVVLGLPLLLSGEEGSQANIVIKFNERLQDKGISSSMIDERYTTPKSNELDKDAASACKILSLRLDLK